MAETGEFGGDLSKGIYLQQYWPNSRHFLFFLLLRCSFSYGCRLLTSRTGKLSMASWNRRLWKLLVHGLAVIIAVVVFFAGVVVRVGIVSLGGLGGPRGPCGPLSFCDLCGWCGRLSMTLIVTACRTLSCVHSVCVGDEKTCIILTQETLVLSQECRLEFHVVAQVILK